MNYLTLGVVLFCCAAAGAAKIEKPWWLWQDISLDANMNRVAHSRVQARNDDLGFRLMNETVPYHYSVWLKTDIHSGSFLLEGRTSIYVDVINQTNLINLHAFFMQINDVKVRAVLDDWAEIQVTNFTLVTEFEQLLITLDNDLSADVDYVIDIEYNGYLQSSFEGFFGNFWIDEAGNQRWFAATQFKPIDARLAFPCYDEPKYRTTFDLVINHDSSYHAQSNMPGTEAQLGDGRAETTFERTPAMPTHLLAFLVSEFESQELESTSGVLHQMFTQPDLVESGDFALDSAHRLLHSMGEFFGIDYPLEKYTQVAIPRYFLMAMGNWGFSIYNNELVLIDDDSTIQDIEIAAVVLAHEVAHQWFGSLITPEWWSFLWLNEGFATFFEFYALDGVFPEMRMHEFFSVMVLQFTMRLDVGNVQPMNFYVQGFQEIMGQFNFVTFTKAACVIRQFHHAFGQENFMKAMTDFLSHPDGVVTPDDLYDAIETHIDPLNILPDDVSVKDVFDSWASQPGFPIVSVYRNRDTGEVYLTQDPWNVGSPLAPPQTWWIPLNAAHDNDPSFESTEADFWIPQYTRMIEYEPEVSIGPDDWIVFNKQQTGYYRVNYDSHGWRLISEALFDDFEQIPPTSRAQLLEDSFLLAEDGILDFGIAMNVMNYLPQEMDIAPWLIISRNLRFLDNLVEGQEFYNGFQEFFRRSTDPVLDFLGTKVVEGELFLVTQQRQVVMEWNCAMMSGECLDEAVEQLEADLAGTEIIHSEMRSIIECYGVRGGPPANFYHFIELGTDESLEAAACSSDVEVVSPFVAQVFADTTSLDFYERRDFIEKLVSKSYFGHSIVLDYCLTNLDTVLDSNITNYWLWDLLADELTTERQLSKLIELFVRISSTFNQNSLSDGVNRAKTNLRWINLHGPALSKWVDERLASINQN